MRSGLCAYVHTALCCVAPVVCDPVGGLCPPTPAEPPTGTGENIILMKSGKCVYPCFGLVVKCRRPPPLPPLKKPSSSNYLEKILNAARIVSTPLAPPKATAKRRQPGTSQTGPSGIPVAFKENWDTNLSAV